MDRSMLLERVSQVVRSFCTVPSTMQLRGATAIAPLCEEALDWYDLLNEVDKILKETYDFDVDEWERLGGAPSQTRPVDPSVTLDRIVDYIQKSPVNNLERAVRRALMGVFQAKSPDEVVLEKPISVTPREWIELRPKLNLHLVRFQTEISEPQWFDLGRGKVDDVVTHETPTGRKVLDLVKTAYTECYA